MKNTVEYKYFNFIRLIANNFFIKCFEEQKYKLFARISKK